jgi:hypothetical protein
MSECDIPNDISDTHTETTKPFLTENTTKTALDELHRVRAAMPEILKYANEQLNCGTLPFLFWGAQWSPVQEVIAPHADGVWLFIGDIHGDFFALHTLLEEASRHPDSYICFLGDIVDRGPHGIECFARILEFAENLRNTSRSSFPRVAWILGNHDEALSTNPKADKKFRSNVEPAEFVDYLNGLIPSPLQESELTEYGRLFIDICERLPRAILFPSGLLATHGGIPLEDRWQYLKTMESLNHKRCLEDFTWTRASKVPTKKGWKYDPQRRTYSSSFEYGYRDLEGFCKAVENFFPVKSLVRGHDHVEGGYEIPEEFSAIPVLTLNGFGFHHLSNAFSSYRTKLIIGLSKNGDFPKVVQIPYCVAELKKMIQSEKLENNSLSGQ